MPHYKTPDNKLHWLDSTEGEKLLPTGAVKITEAEADKILADAEAAKPAPTYDLLRAAAYPSITDQLDALMKAAAGDDAQLKKIAQECMEVKAEYPKPSKTQ